MAWVVLIAGDLTTQRFVDLPEAAVGSDDMDAAQYSSDSNNDVVILLDIRKRPDFIQEAYAREFINRVQRTRKRAGCQATDDMEIYIAFTDAESQAALTPVLQGKADVIARVLKRVPEDDGQRDKSRPVYYEDAEGYEQEVGESKFRLVLLQAAK